MLINKVKLKTDPSTIILNDAAKIAGRNRFQVEKAIADDLIDHCYVGESDHSRGMKSVVVNEKWRAYLESLKNLDRAKKKSKSKKK